MSRAFAGTATVLLVVGCAASTPSNAPPSVTGPPPMSPSPTLASVSASAPSVTATSAEAASAPPGAFAVQAGEGPVFRPNVLETAISDVQVFLTSPPVESESQNVPHNLGIRAPGTLDIIARSDYVQPGESIVFTVSGLQPGTYQFVCEVPGHAGAGMVGTLIVGAG